MTSRSEHGAARMAHLIVSILNAVTTLGLIFTLFFVWFHMKPNIRIISHAQAVIVRLQGR